MRLVFALIAILAISACGDDATNPALDPALSSLDAAARPSVVTYKRVVAEELEAHIFLPSNWRSGDRRTAYVWLHGGGFIVGGPTDGHDIAAAIAERGMVGISAQYRLSVPRVPGPKIDGAIADARSIVRWVRTHSSQLGVDPTAIVASGHSAGAFLVAAGAIFDRWDDEPASSVSALPDAMILWSAPIFEDRMFLATVLPPNVALADVVPSFHVRGGLPPSVLIHGAADPLVSPSYSVEFGARLTEAGSQSEVRLIPGADHFFLDPMHRAVLFAETFDALESLGF